MSEAILSDNSIVCEEQQTKEWTPAKVIYTGLMAFNLLSFLWLLATGSGIEMPPVIWIARIATAPLAIYLGKLWKDRGFQILSVYTLFFCFRTYIPNPENIFSVELSESVLSALWLFAGCYGLGKILTKEALKRFLFVFVIIWTVGMLVYSSVALYAAWNDYHIYVSEAKFFGMLHGRLMMIYVPTTAGAILSTSLVLIAITALSTKSKGIRIFFCVSALPLLLTLSMTDSRTAFVSLAIGISTVVYLKLLCTFRENQSLSHRKRNIIPVLCMIMCFIIVIFLVLQLAPLYNRIKTKGLITSALAKERSKVGWVAVEQRGITGIGEFSGRLEIWKSVINYLIKHPVQLLIGRTKILPLQGIIEGFAHCHSLPVQVLLESGIVGLSAVVLFCLYVCILCIRTVRTGKRPLWIMLIPAVILPLMAVDFVEVFSWLRSSQCPMNAILFISAGIVSAKTASNRQKEQ